MLRPIFILLFVPIPFGLFFICFLLLFVSMSVCWEVHFDLRVLVLATFLFKTSPKCSRTKRSYRSWEKHDVEDREEGSGRKGGR